MKTNQPEGRKSYYVGMDVHLDSFTIDYYCWETGKSIVTVKTAPTAEAVQKSLRKFMKKNGVTDEGEFLFGYEAGYYGYSLYLDFKGLDLDCVIVAPTSISELSNKARVKNDRNDARILSRAIAHGQYSEVRVPDEKCLNARSVVRVRDGLRMDQGGLKRRLLALLHQHGCHYGSTGTYWTQKHFKWIRDSISTMDPAVASSARELLTQIERLDGTIREMDRQIEELAEDPEFKDNVAKLACLKGVSVHTAMLVISEIGDFSRFPSAVSFARFLGLMPGEKSSGKKHQNTGITRDGNRRVRQALIESAQGYVKTNPSYKSKDLLKRQEGVGREYVVYADRCLERICREVGKLKAKMKSPNKIKAAVAKELSFFIWGMMTDNIA